MLRRQARERREYIYRKSAEQEKKLLNVKKQKISDAIDGGDRIPHQLKDEADKLKNIVDWEDNNTKKINSEIDDEYRCAGLTDPKIVVTTSHNPSAKLKEFVKVCLKVCLFLIISIFPFTLEYKNTSYNREKTEVRLLFPTSQRINRGNVDIKQLVQVCRKNGVTDLIFVHEHRGVPDGLVISHLPYGPTAYFTISNVVMRHDIEAIAKLPESYPHLIFDGFKTDLGFRVTNILKYLFPVPKLNSKRIVTFSNTEDFISMRHHAFKKYPELKLMELGPRFEMKLYKIILGTIDLVNISKVEWVHRPFMRTTKKRVFL
ncbi:U3 small nucleolar ribonucleoprotein IMP4 [Intoshia linei]|uniref:U3 small nucleolar ribonucleoprotein IMP4 n=1 Tax=Intoshia linei TaxID=1819745 RepID=A0A177BD18_9BILA|nr:U3 small nucleolar ribonucleoprotein IMP4 [Intoshia linei]